MNLEGLMAWTPDRVVLVRALARLYSHSLVPMRCSAKGGIYGGKSRGARLMVREQSQNALRPAHYQCHYPERIALD